MPIARSLSLLLVIASTALAAESSPDFKAAIELFQQRKNPEAKVALENVVKAEPKNFEAAAYMGRVHMRLGDPESAIKIFEKVVAEFPAHSDYRRELGDAYGFKAQKAGVGFSGLGAARKSRDAYEKAVQLDPKNVNARFNLMQFYQQAPGLVGGGTDKAHAQADEILKLDPIRGRAAKAGVFTAEKKFDEAFALYEDALKENPDDYNSLYAIGRGAASSGQRLERGMEALARCLAVTPPANSPGHAAANWRMGMIHEKRSDKAAARASYQAAISVDPAFKPAVDALKNLK